MSSAIAAGQRSLFGPHRLPHRPYCTDDYEAGTWPRQLSTALQRRYIQPNPPAVRFRLLFDVDRPAARMLGPMPTWRRRTGPAPIRTTDTRMFATRSISRFW